MGSSMKRTKGLSNWLRSPTYVRTTEKDNFPSTELATSLLQLKRGRGLVALSVHLYSITHAFAHSFLSTGINSNNWCAVRIFCFRPHSSDRGS